MTTDGSHGAAAGVGRSSSVITATGCPGPESLRTELKSTNLLAANSLASFPSLLISCCSPTNLQSASYGRDSPACAVPLKVNATAAASSSFSIVVSFNNPPGHYHLWPAAVTKKM